jgi:hypothetical protein
MENNIDPIIHLIAFSNANLIVFVVGLILQIVLIPLLPLIRDFNDNLAKTTCGKQEKLATKNNDEELAKKWKWKDAEKSPVMCPLLTGIIERFFFVVAAYFWMPGFTIAAIAWIGIKMLPGWTVASNCEGGSGEAKQVAFSRLRTSFVSLSLAIFIGVGCRAAVLAMA